MTATAAEVRQTSAPPRTRRVPAQAQPPETPTQNAVSGILDTTGNNSAFLRTAGYRLSPDDVSVPASLVRQYGLRRGDYIAGAARAPGAAAPGRGSQPRARAQHDVLAQVDTVNGLPAARAHDRPSFDALTPLYADDRLRLEDGSASATARIIDLVGPIGRGQRGLIVSPPKAGKTMVLKEIAAAIAPCLP